MVSTKNVNLDAMILREDLAFQDGSSNTMDNQGNIGIRDLVKRALLLPNLRKPDFQRETNHWSPEQVLSLIESFMDGDLIPAVILWRSYRYVFVIDGAHRVSALRAWIEDDYGDGYLSQKLFSNDINSDQRQAAKRTRTLINKNIGGYHHWIKLNEDPDNTKNDKKRRNRLSNFSTRSIPIQWVPGDVDKAENSFFKINTKGTPLDEVEETLIRNRRKPIAIVARSIIRAGQGHKYWSSFDSETKQKIEDLSKEINTLLFKPEKEEKIRTLDLPLGGVAGVRNALKLLMELALVSVRDQHGSPYEVRDQDNDTDGKNTIELLNKMKRLVKRITGNDAGSLGLHPAVYFYSAAGRYSAPMFMGIAILLARKMAQNDKGFFKKFTDSRQVIEDFIINNKPLMAAISNNLRSKVRNKALADLFNEMVTVIAKGGSISTDTVTDIAGFQGTSLTQKVGAAEKGFRKETKNAVFIREAIKSALICPICDGKISNNSISFDHITRLREGGSSTAKNCQPLHPFCNSAMKN